MSDKTLNVKSGSIGRGESEFKGRGAAAQRRHESRPKLGEVARPVVHSPEVLQGSFLRLESFPRDAASKASASSSV